MNAIFGKARFAGVSNMPGRKQAATAAADKRRPLIAKVHVARKEMALVEDDYRAVLLRVVGRSSARDCSDAELIAVLEEFKRLGWKPAQPTGRRPGRARPADTPMAKKARAMWISLHQLGAIANPAEAALEAFAARQLGCTRMQWADQSLAYRLIEALKAIGARHGWDLDMKGVRPEAQLLVTKRRLIDALIAKLQAVGLVPAEWAAERAIFEFSGLELHSVTFATLSELDLAAQALGRKLASAGEMAR